jgi:hypothetical protein
MKKMLERKVYWIAGTFVGLSGVVMVRLIAPGLSGVINTIVMISGYLLSLAGIVIIACSTRDRAIVTQNERQKVLETSKEGNPGQAEFERI